MSFYMGSSIQLRNFVQTNEFFEDIKESLDETQQFENYVDGWYQET